MAFVSRTGRYRWFGKKLKVEQFVDLEGKGASLPFTRLRVASRESVGTLNVGTLNVGMLNVGMLNVGTLNVGKLNVAAPEA